MAGTRVSIDGLADAVMESLSEYARTSTEDVKTAVRKAGNTGAYAKSWSVKTEKETSASLEVVVHSRNRYQLAHLLEYGHAKRGGGRVSAKPHIAAAEQKGLEELKKNIEKVLRG